MSTSPSSTDIDSSLGEAGGYEEVDSFLDSHKLLTERDALGFLIKQHKEELEALKKGLNRREDELLGIIATKEKEVADLTKAMQDGSTTFLQSQLKTVQAQLATSQEALAQEKEMTKQLEKKVKEAVTSEREKSKELEKSTQGNDKLLNEVRVGAKRIKELEKRDLNFEELKDKCSDLEGRTALLQTEIIVVQSQLAETQDALALEKRKTRTLEKTAKDTEEEFNELKLGASRLKELEKRESNFNFIEEKCTILEGQLNSEMNASEHLQFQLQTTQTKLINVKEELTQEKEKTKKLEKNLQDISKELNELKTEVKIREEKVKEFEKKDFNVEAVKEKCCALEGQSTLLQTQLATAHSQLAATQEVLVQEKEKVKLLERSSRENERTINDLRVDLRIETRRLKELEKFESDRGTLKEKCSTLEGQLAAAKNSVELRESKLKTSESQLASFEEALTKEQLKNVQLEKSIQEILKQENEKTSQLEKNIKEKDKLTNDLKLYAKKIKEMEKKVSRVELLKEACSVLETQLKEFEDALGKANYQVEALTSQKNELNDSLNKTKEALRTSNSQMNEFKSMRIFNEKQIEQLKSRLNSEEMELHNQLTSSNQQLARSTEIINNYEIDLKETRSKCTQLESELESWKSQVEHFKGLVTTSRNESSTFLMQIVKLKEANIQLQNGFEESVVKCEKLKATINELNQNAATLRAEKMDNDLRFESIVQQQTKLIEHLQKQLEVLQAKKPRGLVERIFGSGGGHIQSSKTEQGGSSPFTMPRTPVSTPVKSATLQNPARKVDLPSTPVSTQIKTPTFHTPIQKTELPSSPLQRKVLTEIQNVTKKIEAIEDVRPREQCLLLKEDEEDNNLIQKTVIYREDKQLDINCCLALHDGILLIGCVDGLYSINKKKGIKTKIDGIDTVWAMAYEADKDFAVAIEGPQRNLVRVNLGLLRACAEAAECSKPKITSTGILKLTNAYMFKMKNSHVAVAGEKYLKILQIDQDRIHIKFTVQTPTNVTSLLLTSQQTLLFGTDMVYELDLLNGQVEEFIDSTDSTLQINIANCTQFNQYPLAILDVTSRAVNRKNEILHREYLVAFPDFGIFLDENGRRSRELDIEWSKLPTSIEYHQPNLYVEHFTCIEVIQLNSNSFTRVAEPSLFVHLKTPKILDCESISEAMLVVSTKKNLTEIYKVNYPTTSKPNQHNIPTDMTDDSSGSNSSSDCKITITTTTTSNEEDTSANSNTTSSSY